MGLGLCLLSLASEKVAVGQKESRHVKSSDALWVKNAGVGAVSFSSDGRTIAAVEGGLGKYKLTLRSATTGRLVRWRSLRGGQPTSLAYGGRGGAIVAGGGDNSVTIWKLSANRLKRIQVPQGTGINSVALSPRDDLVASCSSNSRLVFLWSLPQGKPLGVLKHKARSIQTVAFSPSGKYLVSGSWDGVVTLWSLDKKKAVWTRSQPRTIQGLLITEDERIVICALADSSLQFRDIKSGNLVRAQQFQPAWYGPDVSVLSRNAQTFVRGVTLHPRATAQIMEGRFSSEKANGIVEVCNVKTGKSLCRIGGMKQLYSVALAGNGRTVVISGQLPNGRETLSAWRF
jgi:WD40 repeat protein